MALVKKSEKLTACIAYLIALISGGVGIFAYSPFDYVWIAFLSASGLIWLAAYQPKRIALIGSFLWAVSYFAIGVNWVHISMIQFGGVPEIVSYLAVGLLAIYLSLYPLLFAFIAQRFEVKSPWVLAALWTFTEYLRSVVFTGFPWLQFGYTQIDTPFANLATLFGVEGLTFFVIIVSGYAVKIVSALADQRFLWLPFGSLLLIFAAAVSTTFIRFVKIDENQPALNISVVQGNIEQKMKWDSAYFDNILNTYRHLLQQVVGKSNVIVLPESAIPMVEKQIEPLMTQLDQLGREKGSEIIIGTLHQDQSGVYNSALALGGISPYTINQSPRYVKHHLVPFGEYVPFGGLLDFLRDVFVLPTNLSQGAFIQPSLFAGEQRFNMAICYEIIFGHQVQQNQQAQQADYLLTITNDAWFGESSGPWQHFQMARMRALELGKPLIRAANTGITAFVDFNGKVMATLPQFESRVLTHTVQPTKGETLYGRFGRALLYGLSGMILLLGWLISRKRN